MNFTSAQHEAIEARGDTLVIAGAGTGKTRTLVERCARRLLDETENVGIDEILVVTFTEAAAAEIRRRIRERLEAELERRPDHPRLLGQLASLDTAHISTLHSFCLKLIREHFHELAIDPDLNVLADEQSALLAEETLNDLFEAHYAGNDAASQAVRRFLQHHARGWEEWVRELIVEVHHFTQTRPDPQGWFEVQSTHFAAAEPEAWQCWLIEGVNEWRDLWLPVLREQPPENIVAHRCATLLEETAQAPASAGVPAPGHLAHVTAQLRQVLQQDIPEHWPRGTKQRFRDPIKKMFDDAAFLETLAPGHDGADPLREDWDWVREPMQTLLGLAREFDERFAEAKRQRGVVDFHDLEQFALRLLWDRASRQPTPLARQWQARLRLVFVDEYQDINEAQDTILRALARPGEEANRFLVGDVKQSIYRFRQAAPHIFQDYARQWTGEAGAGKSVFLSDNFRSREGLLGFINPLFQSLMRPDIGGVDYDERAALRFGAPEERRDLAQTETAPPRVEVLLRLKEKAAASEEGDAENEPSSSAVERSDAETEARIVGQRLQELRRAGHQVWDDEQQVMRSVDWDDMVILLRSPRAKVESYAKEFARLGIPLAAKRTGFFDSIEVQDLLNLLNVLDNPLQDLPVVAVLRSPLAGLTVEELAHIRLAAPKARFWTALNRWYELQLAERGKVSCEGKTDASNESSPAGLYDKVATFLGRFHHWRAQSRQASLAQRLELVLTETYYREWLLTQDRGEQRLANVSQLLALAREFDELNAQGLHRFLRLIEAQQEAAGDREPAPLETGRAVRLMSIHQSKGLEFPVVVVADLGKRFNVSESRHGLILDERFGLCPQVKPPHSGRQYPSLPLWLTRKRQRAEALGEEMRILYVALTRAQDTLLLCGTCSAKSAREKWPERASASPPARQLLQAMSFLDWVGPWLTHTASSPDWTEREGGDTATWSWRILRDSEPEEASDLSLVEPSEAMVEERASAEEKFVALQERLDWRYPFSAPVHAPAKASVTLLRRQLSEADEEAQPASFAAPSRFQFTRARGSSLNAGEIGSAHHRFLQRVKLEETARPETLRQEGERLRQAGWLSQEECDALRWKHLAAFWGSELGQLLRNESSRVQRELPFTCRLTSEDLLAFQLAPVAAVPPGEYVVVQGVVDLALMRDEEIWLLDFKTDRVTSDTLAAKIDAYTPQLQLYALALSRIYGRPVTKRWLHFLAMEKSVTV